MSPFNAIRAATIEPATYLRMLDSAGTIAAGKVADVVLLSANPLRDINATRRIVAVVANGHFIDSAERARLIASASKR
jgi:imidazolonepropionase-like amidohydrolase